MTIEPEQTAPTTEASLDERAAAIASAMTAETAANPEATTETEAKAAEPEATKNERQKRLEALRAVEAEKSAKRQQYREQRERDERIQALQAERDALAAKAKLAESLEATINTEEGFFELAQRSNVSPEKLAAYIREQIADPTRDAVRKAQQAVTPEVEALRTRLAELEARDKAREEQAAKHAVYLAEQEARHTLVSMAAQFSDSAPHAVRYLKNLGQDAFLELAENVGRTVPEGAGAQALFDAIEIQLEQLAAVYNSQTTNSKPTQRPAAAKATPTSLSNRAASARTTVVEEADNSSLSQLDERAARLKMLLGASKD